MTIQPHWRNPWPSAVYVPLEELAALIADGSTSVRISDTEIVPYDADIFLVHVRQKGRRLDAYLLRPAKPNYFHIEAGVRYDHAGPRYFSYLVPERNWKRALDLIRKHG